MSNFGEIAIRNEDASDKATVTGSALDTNLKGITTENDRLNVNAVDFYAQVSFGQVAGYEPVHISGSGEVTTALTPITESGFFRTPSATVTLEFVSDNADDNPAGTGAHELTIEGLNANWDRITQSKATNGLTPVVFDTDMIRVTKAYVSLSGIYASQFAGSHLGIITIREPGPGNLWSIIPNTPIPFGETSIGVTSIPAGKTGYVIDAHIVVDSNKAIDVYLFRRTSADDVLSPYSGILRILSKFKGVTGEVYHDHRMPQNGLIGPCDIGFMAQTISGTGRLSVDAELILRDT